MPTSKHTPGKPPKALLTPIKHKPFPKRPGLGNQLLSGFDENEFIRKHENDFLEIEKHVFSEKLKKLNLLLDYYDIKDAAPDTKWFNLCLAMADHKFAGFKVLEEKKRGRKESWNMKLLAKLYFQIEAQVNQWEIIKPVFDRKLSIIKACDILVKKQPWASLNITSEALQVKYYAAKKSPLLKLYIACVAVGSLRDNENIEIIHNVIDSNN